MTALAFQAILLALQEAPEVIQYINLAKAAQDITPEQLTALQASEVAAHQDLLVAIAAAKA